LKQKKDISRRRLICYGAAAVVTAVMETSRAAQRNRLRTPAQTAGPFYPVRPQQDKDLDLTRIEGRAHWAKGEVIEVQGRVLDEDGSAITDALVEIWQANTFGRYRHERDPNPAPLDPDFQGWGQVLSTAGGAYRFKTIIPGAYPANADWMRPPHIHFKVTRRGYVELVTQMYFPENELNESDLILQSLTQAQQLRVIAQKRHGDQQGLNRVPQYDFDIVLVKVI
jgi:protocatechuate 3,4-dioxygenase beta subunit